MVAVLILVKTALSLTLSLIAFDLSAYNINELIITQFIKASLAFRFFENNSDGTREIIAEFVSRYHSSSWEGYLKNYLPIVIAIIKKENEGSLDLIVTKNGKYEKSCAFLDSLILNEEPNLEDLDFISVRSHPFIKVDEGKYRLISPVFTCEKIYESLYFEFAQINKILKSKNKAHITGDFRGFYCLKYSEEYLLYEILNRSIPNKHIKLTGEDLRNNGITGEPDYYWRNGNKIFLFESKDVFVNAEVKQSNDFQLIEEALKTKFYYYTKRETIHYVGIIQLINSISSILKNEYNFDSINIERVRIYPILIIHHNIYNTPGLNLLLNEWFRFELEKLQADGLITDNVNDLVVIDMNTFILYGEQLRNRKIQLEVLISDYIDFSKGRLNKIIGKSLEERARDSIDSFSTYLSFHKRLQWRVPSLFEELGYDLFKT